MLKTALSVIKYTALGTIVALVFFGGPVVLSTYHEASFDKGALALPDNTVFEDRNGRELRFVPDSGGERHIRVDGGAIPKTLKDAFLASEDARFYEHGGFDSLAILRAARDDLKAGRIVSGASTISQQLIRLAYPRKRTLHDKLVETFRSVRMEGTLTKGEILTHYLNRVPMGNNIVGVELASRAYFGKSCRGLSPAQCALLASIPKAPGSLNPLGPNTGRLMNRKAWVLKRMKELGSLTEAQYAEAMREPLNISFKPFPFYAPHFVDLLIRRGLARPGGLKTTLELGLQTEVEKILASHKARLEKRGAVQAAAIVVQNDTMETLALAGSLEYSEDGKGFNNGATTLRSAGSTLKPFLYALALEKGHTASELIEDTQKKYRSPNGLYTPYNFDRKQYGPVTVRTALGNSLNLSAVKMLESVGYDPFYKLLINIRLINRTAGGPDGYGLGMAVGNPEVSLEELTAAYAMLANSGTYRPIRYSIQTPDAKGTRVFEPETAYIISDILSDPSARLITFGAPMALDFPFRVAVKTGTSTKYRDCWAVGYTSEYTIGVWVGNFGGSPTRGLSGSTAAVPVFADIMGILYGSGAVPAPFSAPTGVVMAKVCGYSGMRPTEHCFSVTEELFIAGTEPRKDCTFHTGGPDIHELDAPYSAWLYDKYRQGSEGKFRIAQMPEDLSEAFEDPEDTDMEVEEDAPVRVTGSAVRRKPSEAGTQLKPAGAGRYSITSARQDAGLAASAGRNHITIAYPMDGDRYVIDSYAGRKTLRLQAVTEKPVAYIEWFMDGKPLSKTRPPYQTYWGMTRGRHRITVLDPWHNAASARITVE